MKHYLPIILLVLTMAGGLSIAAEPPVPSTPATPTSPLDPPGFETDSKPQFTRATLNQSVLLANDAEGAFKPIQAVGAKTPKFEDDPGYTQIGRHFTLKFDRPKTELRLYENSSYRIHSGRDSVDLFNPDSRLIKIEESDRSGISFHTIEPGTMTLMFVDDEDAEVKYYNVEVTILGDTRQLQSQLEKLYPRASIEAIKIGESVLLRGTTSKREHIAEIIEIAEQFYPKTLNQLKVAEAPLGQALPIQPPVIGGYAPLSFPSGTYALPKPIPASPASTIQKQITVQAVVLEIDWEKLKATKIDLENTIRAFAIDPKQRGLSVQPTKKPPFIPVVVPWQTTDGIVQFLTATKAAKVISRPVIRTLDGQPAEISIGERIPIAEKKASPNGWHDPEVGYHDTGTTLKLTPKLTSHGGTKLSFVIKHNQQVDSPNTNAPEGNEVSYIPTHIFDSFVELKVGQSAILTETDTVVFKNKKISAGKGLMVILSPPVIGMASQNVVWFPETTFKWIPEQNRFAKVVRMVPKRIPSMPGADNGIDSDWHDADSPTVPQPNRTPVYADPNPASQSGPQDLRQSVRELRSDVRVLRKDVKKLLRLLEDQTSAKPTVGAIHRRIKESKTDLLFFHASWSGPSQKMAAILDEQAIRDYSIRRLDIDIYPQLANDYSVKSVPTIVALANGKEDERWVGIMGKDALTRIVDKYAPRQTANLKGNRGSDMTRAERKLYQALNLHQALMKEVSLNSEKMPLANVMRTLNQSEGINIFIDTRGLDEVGITPNHPITIQANEIRLQSVLNLILEPLQLTYQVRGNTLVITSKTRAQGKMTAVTYPVADLAIPIPLAGLVSSEEKAHPVRSPAIDFDSLTELIQSMVQPRSWEMVGGSASIRPHDSTLSLVIRQSSEGHQEIAGLLAQLRRVQDIQVTVESSFLDKLPEDIWKNLGIDFDSMGKQRGNGPLGGIILTDQQADLLLQAAQNNDRSNVIQGPQITLFNGRTAVVTDFMVGRKQHPLNQALHLQPVISADRRNVRLNLQVSDLESLEAETRAYVNTVPNGKTLLIEIVPRDANEVGVPMSETMSNDSKLFKSTRVHRTKPRRFLLIRPRIIVQDEQKESFLPPASKLPLMLTPRGVIPEEEEPLLGIAQPE